jgi:8-amino-3,8-dideoxy-alpha-D-manno-octulosonate transaminase
VRWVVRPPRVRGRVAPAMPGAVRIAQDEADAAAEAAREVVRSKRLFRYGGVSPSLLDGSRVRRLERAFARTIGVEHALAVNSGTSALVCGLVGLGVGPGDEVIVPAYTWFSTASAVVGAGAVPVVAEVDESLTLDPRDVRARISPHTRAIVAVHMRGAPADMDALLGVAREAGLRVLEDVAQAAGASYRGRRLGSLGDAGAFSFQMSKMITAGEGGMVVTGDAAVHRRAAMYHDSGELVHGGVPEEGWLPGLNLRLSELQAAVLLVQLERLDGILADLRARKAALEERVAARLVGSEVALRTVHDPAGEAGLALVLFLPDAARAQRAVSMLADENVPATRLYRDGGGDYVDLHAYPAWGPILAKRGWAARGEPWHGHGREVEYSEDACPRTVDLLRRAVHVDVSAELTPRQADQMGTAIADAVEAVL